MKQPGLPASAEPGMTGGLSEQLIRELVGAAAAAPSMHNTQPWRFLADKSRRLIEVFADPARQLPYGDPEGRAVHIACGAALLNLRLAAAAAGYQAATRLLPDPGQPRLLATVRLRGYHRAGSQERALHAAIGRRHTNRQPFTGEPVPPPVLAEMQEAGKAEGALVHVLGHAEAVRVLQLAAAAEGIQLSDPAYRAELARWAGGERDSDGIPASVLGPRDAYGLTPVRDFTPGRWPLPGTYARFETEPQLIVLSVPASTPEHWLRAGQALQRVLLTATAAGIAVSPLTQPMETGDAWLVRDPHTGTEYPQMILRIGYGPPVPPTPRRQLSDILGTAPSPGHQPPRVSRRGLSRRGRGAHGQTTGK